MASLSAWIRSLRLAIILAVLLCGMWESRTRSASFAFLLQFCLGRAVLRSGERSCASWSSSSSADRQRLASLGFSRERVRFVFPDSMAGAWGILQALSGVSFSTSVICCADRSRRRLLVYINDFPAVAYTSLWASTSLLH